MAVRAAAPTWSPSHGVPPVASTVTASENVTDTSMPSPHPVGVVRPVVVRVARRRRAQRQARHHRRHVVRALLAAVHVHRRAVHLPLVGIRRQPLRRVPGPVRNDPAVQKLIPRVPEMQGKRLASAMIPAVARLHRVVEQQLARAAARHVQRPLRRAPRPDRHKDPRRLRSPAPRRRTPPSPASRRQDRTRPRTSSPTSSPHAPPRRPRRHPVHPARRIRRNRPMRQRRNPHRIADPTAVERDRAPPPPTPRPPSASPAATV